MASKTRSKPAPPKHGTCRWTAGNDRAREQILDGREAHLEVCLAGADSWASYTVQPILHCGGLGGWLVTRWDYERKE